MDTLIHRITGTHYKLEVYEDKIIVFSLHYESIKQNADRTKIEIPPYFQKISKLFYNMDIKIKLTIPINTILDARFEEHTFFKPSRIIISTAAKAFPNDSVSISIPKDSQKEATAKMIIETIMRLKKASTRSETDFRGYSMFIKFDTRNIIDTDFDKGFTVFESIECNGKTTIVAKVDDEIVPDYFKDTPLNEETKALLHKGWIIKHKAGELDNGKFQIYWIDYCYVK